MNHIDVTPASYCTSWRKGTRDNVQAFEGFEPSRTQYKDRRFEGTEADWEDAINTSTTVYIGNLAFFTREEQIYDIFARVGMIKRVIMGLDKHQKTPCGFAFVAYYTRKDAEASVSFLNGTLLDDRPIRVDIDWGFLEGRQYGRGRSGGQVRDEYRQDYDPGRGGFGKILQREMMAQLGMGQDVAAGQFRGGARGDQKRQRVEGGGARPTVAEAAHQDEEPQQQGAEGGDAQRQGDQQEEMAAGTGAEHGEGGGSDDAAAGGAYEDGDGADAAMAVGGEAEGEGEDFVMMGQEGQDVEGEGGDEEFGADG